jgi:hypothetical protein
MRHGLRLQSDLVTTLEKDPENVNPGGFARRILAALGPGLITGASDDDPSGIGTYSQAGAQFGFSIGWTMLLTYPLMAAIQEISARIGRTTGHGIAGNLCRHYPNWLLYGVVTLLFIANTINIGTGRSSSIRRRSSVMGFSTPSTSRNGNIPPVTLAGSGDGIAGNRHHHPRANQTKAGGSGEQHNCRLVEHFCAGRWLTWPFCAHLPVSIATGRAARINNGGG